MDWSKRNYYAWSYHWKWSIIEANSVVAQNVGPYTIVVGNPIKVIRKRFDDELIELLQELAWWDKSIDEINALIPILTCSDLQKVKMAIQNLKTE